MTAPLQARLAHVALRSPDPARAAGFYRSVLGLSERARRADGTVELGWGRGHHAVEVVPGATAGLDHFALEVADAASLEGLRARLDAAGISVTAPGPRGASLALEDPDGHRVLVHVGLDRAGESQGAPGRRPIRVQHVTLASPHVAALTAFYVDVLGFRLSDRIAGDAFCWLRSDVEHHTIAIVAAGAAGLDHVSFDVEDWSAFKAWGDQLAGKGVPISWGPGRHGPGNNLFVFFDDPDGVRIELSAEMERYWDQSVSYAPRTWTAGPSTTNLWGPNPTWRAPVTTPQDQPGVPA